MATGDIESSESRGATLWDEECGDIHHALQQGEWVRRRVRWTIGGEVGAMRRTARLVIGSVAVVVVAGLVAACEPDPYQGNPNGPRIAVVGDSLISAIRDTYAESLGARGWNASVTGKGGYTSRDHWDTEERIMRTPPDVVVIALGTNDVREVNEGLQTYDGFRESVRHSLGIVREARCVVWVGINEVSGYYGPGLGNLAEFGWVINVIIQQELARSGRAPGSVQYADWAAASRNHLEYFVGPGDVHHSPVGARAYRATMDAAIARCPMPLPFGWLDVAAGGAGAVDVAGWAIDPFTDEPIDVRVSIGTQEYVVRADSARPDVGAAFGRGDRHGFVRSIPAPPGEHRVCVHAIAERQPGRGNPLIGCRTVTVGAAPPTTSTTSTSTTSTSTTSTSTTSTSTTTTTAPTTTTTVATDQ